MAHTGADMSLHNLNETESKWWDQGACRGLDSSIFYPDDEVEAQSAKAVCSGCAVQRACLDHALTFREKSGVWGGATERDRRRIIRQRRSSNSASG